MPISVPVPDRAAGDVFTETMWDAYLRDNINKLLDRGHRVLTVAQFAALTGLEDGDEAYVEVDATNGIMWHLRYVAAETTYKWRYLGGPPLESLVVASQGTFSTSYVDLGGPSVTLPRSGDYDVELGARGDGGPNGYMSYAIGAVAAADADALRLQANDQFISAHRYKRKPGLGAVALAVQVRSSDGNFRTAADRQILVRPARIRHDA